MFFLGSPNIQKMAAERDFDGLVKCLDHRSTVVRLEAAGALAELNDGRGWRYLLDVLRHPENADTQAAAAEMLAELGHPRALPALKEALPAARGPAREAIEEALQILGEEAAPPPTRPLIPDPQDRDRPVEGESILSTILGGMAEGEGFDGGIAQPVLPSGDIDIFSAQQHLDNAIQLRENELQERGLVECMLALWLQPGWAYAWYLRGVLFEDLEREREAYLSYGRALALDPTLPEAREAYSDLADSLGALPDQPEEMIKELLSDDWRERRDGAALLGEWLSSAAGRGRPAREQAVDALIEALSDPEREVRHSAIEALGRSEAEQAAGALVEKQESSWLLRITILQALSDLASVKALLERLRIEMDGLQERNPIFTSQRDPLLELEYGLILEAGVLALERTGDLEGLLELAENSVWEEVEEEEEELLEEDEEYMEDEELDEELDEDLESYVDEPLHMAGVALQRLAFKTMPELRHELLERLAQVPDLTLLDLEDEESEPAILVDYTELREQARKALER